MTDSTWKRTWEVFYAAIELPRGERESFVESAANGDASLRAEVLELLANHDATSFVLDHSPAHPKVSPVVAQSSLEGQRIGAYTIRARVGFGGMGVVYDAHQEDPVQRRVALKVIHPGAHPDAAARFGMERQALARMSHPHIASVFDAGVIADGRPFIAMEFVEGVPLTEYCAKNHLDLSERLQLFVLVCQAIQHAHQKGIIHRDIKPSNVLVTVVDGKPAPKVIDFGVAKAVTPVSGSDGYRTVHGVLVGTLEYMSPEQLDPSGTDVDTRSDIYSLGVMLFELITGRLPFDWEVLRAEGLDGLRRVARELEVPRPSRRTTDPAMRRQIEGDLDWILLKALDRDRSRRYASASELADDVRRHLANEPVLAGPPSASYRARKFVRRHRGAVTIAATAVLVMLVVAAALTLQALEIRRSAQTAERERVRAERVSEVMMDVFQSSDPYETRGAEVTARQVLDRSVARVRRLNDEPQVQASVLNSIGRVYGRMGVNESSEKLIRDALTIRRDVHHGDHLEVAESLESLGQVLLRNGKLPEADRALNEAVAMKRRLLPPDDQRRAEGLRLLGGLQRTNGAFDASEKSFLEALRLSQDSPTINPRAGYASTATVLEELGNLYLKMGDHARGEASMRRALAIRRKRSLDDPRTADAMMRLGNIVADKGKLAEGESLLSEGLAIMEKTVGPNSERLAVPLTGLGLVQHNQGKYDLAQANYLRSIEIWKTTQGESHPSIAFNYNNLGLLAHDQGNFTEAERQFLATSALMQKVYKPNNPDIALPISNLARLYHDMGRLAESEKLHRKALEMRRAVLKPGHPSLADTLVWMGKLYTETNRVKEGEAMLREGVEIRAKSFQPDDWRLAEARSLLGGNLMMQGRYAEAEPLLVSGLEGMEKVRGKNYRRTIQARERLSALEKAKMKS